MNMWENDSRRVQQLAGDDMVILLANLRSRKKRYLQYRKWLLVALVVCVSLLCASYFYQIDSSIPSVLHVRAGEEDPLSLHVPATARIVSVDSQGVSNIPKEAVTIDLSEPVALLMARDASYQMQVKLFGVLPFKEVEIQSVQAKELVPVGIPVGIYLKADGILVVGVGDFNGADGRTHSPARNLLKSGDYIRRLNGESIDDKEVFIQRIKECGGGVVALSVERNGQMLDLEVYPVKDEKGVYRIGVWIRDNAQGVGTVTYMDADGNFGALGHGISDVDTSTLMELDDGTLYRTDIIAIHKGTVGHPGELVGMILYADDRIIGDISGNSERGIFGRFNDKGKEQFFGDPLPIGLKQEIEKGPARILCGVDGERKYYDIEITNVRMDNNNVNRGIEFTVTDKELLSLTGGIIQGMSGAPIIQNGKLIGAVTHVLVSDPERGYGIFIETMLEAE